MRTSLFFCFLVAPILCFGSTEDKTAPLKNADHPTEQAQPNIAAQTQATETPSTQPVELKSEQITPSAPIAQAQGTEKATEILPDQAQTQEEITSDSSDNSSDAIEDEEINEEATPAQSEKPATVVQGSTAKTSSEPVASTDQSESADSTGAEEVDVQETTVKEATITEKKDTPTPEAQKQTVTEKAIETPAETAHKEVLNEVRVVIGGPTETILVLTQDVRPWLDGTPRNLRDMVIEQLILIDAESIKLQPSEEEVDKFILQIQKNNNYTHEKILEMLKAIDYTMEEFRAELKRKHAVDMMLDYRVRNDKRMSVVETDVANWWDAHSENQFKLMTAHVKTKLSADEVEQALKNNKLKDPIEWGAPFVVTEAQLPSEKAFIAQKQNGEIVSVEPEAEGFEITKLISHGKEPLKSGNKDQDEKRYKDVERTLHMERYNQIRKEYEANLLKHAHIKFKHEADRIAVMET